MRTRQQARVERDEDSPEPSPAVKVPKTIDEDEVQSETADAARKLPKTVDKVAKLEEAEWRFRKACQQIVLINQRLAEVRHRYVSARRDNLRTFRYSHRLRLAVVEGMRNTYFEYVHMKVEEIADLRQELYGETLADSTDDEFSDTDDYDADY
jgi:hypothetical protein